MKKRRRAEHRPTGQQWLLLAGQAGVAILKTVPWLLHVWERHRHWWWL